MSKVVSLCLVKGMKSLGLDTGCKLGLERGRWDLEKDKKNPEMDSSDPELELNS